LGRPEEEEIRANPTTRRQLERMHMVFRTTLLVSTASEFSNLSITKEELDSWYEWFNGEDKKDPRYASRAHGFE
jgi:hypothetical protein